MEINKALKVEVEKSFSVSTDELYNAWTNPGQLKQWWKPMGHPLQEVTNEIRKGGTVRYVFAGNKLIITGEYLDVKEKQELVYTWNWELPEDPIRNAKYKLTVQFTPTGNGSKIHVIQDNFQDEETMLPHREGWEKGLEELEQFLAGNSRAEREEVQYTQNLLSEGYREDPEQEKVGGG